MGREASPPEKDWMTLRVAPENKHELLEALHIAAAINDLEGATVNDPISRMAEAHRRIVIDWLLENRFNYRIMLTQNAAQSGAAVAIMDALTRDGFRCKKCRHSRVSQGGVVTTCIVTFDMIEARRQGADEHNVFPKGRHSEENMVTLCRGCAADWASLPPARRVAAVPLMLRAIGPQVETAEYEAWIARVSAILLQPDPCQNASTVSNGSNGTKPNTGAVSQTLSK